MALWNYFVPPVAGLIIGYFTNDLAIKMLFRPYRPYRVLGQQLPFTPGLIPQNQPRLAKQISKTIMGSLLTPEELRNLARRLLQLDRIQEAIRWILNIALERLGDPEQQQQTSRVLGRILEDLFRESLPRLLRVWTRREDFLEDQIEQLFDQILLDIKLSKEQAGQLSTWILEQAIPPKILRQGLVDFLTDRNISAVDDEFRQRTTGSYWWFVANFIGAKGALERLRSYFLEEPETADRVLERLLQGVGANQRLTELIQNLSLQNLPAGAVQQLRQGLKQGIQDYLRTEGPQLLENLGESINWQNIAILILGRLRNSKVLQESVDQLSYDLAQILERYLDRDLESLMTQVIPILNLDQVIIDKVKATSPMDLEKAIQQIVKKELQAIVNLGAVLGFIVGCMQTVLLVFY